MITDNDFILFDRIKRDDPIAFELIFKKYYKRLCGLAKKYVYELEIAEEIVQDSFCKMWERRSTINIERSFQSFLFQIIRNNCLNYLKHLAIEQQHFNEKIKEYNYPEYHYITDPDQGYNYVVEKELNAKITEAVNTLPEQCKKIFKLNRFEGLSYKEVAAELNISIKTVETQMSIALEKLRFKLKEFLTIFLMFIK